MIGEVAVKTLEVAAEAAKEIGKKSAEVAEKGIDIGKRVDVTKNALTKIDGEVDISKRIKLDGIKSDIAKNEITKSAKEYINDLKSKAEFPDTIKDLDISKLEVQSPEKVKQLREEFDSNKAELRKEWEQLNHKEWPKYKEDVYNDKGIKIRKAGDCLDAHHEQPLCLGGKNEASNLTPMDLKKHSEIHSANGSCTKLVNAVKGVQ